MSEDNCQLDTDSPRVIAPSMSNSDNALQLLSACPFCGGRNNAIRENGRIWLGMRWSEPVSVSVHHWCDQEPGQPSRAIERAGRDLESAVAAWNRRAGAAGEAA